MTTSTGKAMTVRHLRTAQEIDCVRALRASIDLPTFDAALEKQRDAHAIVVALEVAGQLVGTARLVKMGLGLTFSERSMPPRLRLPGASWEVGRVALTQEHRGVPDVLPQVLAASMRFAVQHQPIDHVYASCTVPLSRLWGRYTFQPVCPAPDDYVVMHSQPDKVLTKLAHHLS